MLRRENYGENRSFVRERSSVVAWRNASGVVRMNHGGPGSDIPRTGEPFARSAPRYSDAFIASILEEYSKDPEFFERLRQKCHQATAASAVA